ncbi:MAG: replication-relaxation family protein, partial [Nitrososphaerales archaeon]
MSKRRYITKARLTSINGALTAQDRSILADVANLNLVSGQQLQRLHYAASEAGRRNARLDLTRLTDLQVLTRLERVIGGQRAGSAGYIYALGVAGQRLIRADTRRYRRPWTPFPNHLRHAMAVSELYVDLRQRESRQGWQLVSFDAEPRCWRGFYGPGGSRLTLKPDAFFVGESDDFVDRLFVEMDCSTEALPRIVDKAKVYVRYWQSGREQAETGVFPWVLWVVPNDQRLRQLVNGLSRLPAENRQLFAVATSAAAADQVLAG